MLTHRRENGESDFSDDVPARATDTAKATEAYSELGSSDEMPASGNAPANAAYAHTEAGSDTDDAAGSALGSSLDADSSATEEEGGVEEGSAKLTEVKEGSALTEVASVSTRPPAERKGSARSWAEPLHRTTSSREIGAAGSGT